LIPANLVPRPASSQEPTEPAGHASPCSIAEAGCPVPLLARRSQAAPAAHSQEGASRHARGRQRTAHTRSVQFSLFGIFRGSRIVLRKTKGYLCLFIHHVQFHSFFLKPKILIRLIVLNQRIHSFMVGIKLQS
jgi:hypothetical protein